MKELIVFVLIILIIILSFTLHKENCINEYFSNKNENDFMISMFLTGGLKEEAENCIQTLKNQNLDNKLIVTALDDEAYSHINKLGVKTVKRNTNLKRKADFGTKAFFDITLNKLDIIKNHLKEHNKIVVYTDTDIVFLKDISSDITKFKNSNYDIMIQNDTSDFSKNDTRNLCTGFIFFKPSKNTISFIEKSQKNMEDRINKRLEGDLADQKSFNEMLKEDKNIKINTLCLKDYPNGKRYFDNVNTLYKDYKPKIVHNNFLKKTDDKIIRFKKHNLWFLKT